MPKKQTMMIRDADNTDLDRIADLFHQLGYATGAGPTGQKLRQLRESQGGAVFVADQDGGVVGVAIVHLLQPLHIEAAWALLSALVVDEQHRSAGIGEQLLARAEGFAKERGCSQLELSSSSTRVQAHAFYERNGYREKRLRFVKTLT
jgi:GNAT superfamily N-acetyltransferase